MILLVRHFGVTIHENSRKSADKIENYRSPTVVIGIHGWTLMHADDFLARYLGVTIRENLCKSANKIECYRSPTTVVGIHGWPLMHADDFLARYLGVTIAKISANLRINRRSLSHRQLW